MSRYLDILNEGREILKNSGIEEYNTDARILFEHIFKMNRTEYLLRQLSENKDDEALKKYMDAIKKRCTHIPLQHITGYQEFMGYSFFVNENTLIPRQDTEILVEKALRKISKETALNDKKLQILDMCTGSGCIAISVAKLAENVDVTGADISEDAIAVAKKNAENLDAKNVQFIKSNLFENISKEKKYDFIISNPPYIKTADIDGLMEEVKIHDPYIALDGKEDGLFFYRKITQAALVHLKENGMLLYEIGFEQAEEVKDIMKKAGFKEIKVIKDLAGLDRVVTGRLIH